MGKNIPKEKKQNLNLVQTQVPAQATIQNQAPVKVKRKHKTARAITYAPGNAISFLANLIFGNSKIKPKAKLNNWEKARRGGFIGTIANTCGHIARSISKFVYKHKKAISIACWVAFSLAAAVAIAGTICMFCFPGAWAAAASFSIFGMTLAGLAGANPGAQIGVAIGLATAFTLGIALIVCALMSTTNTIIRMGKGKNKNKEGKKKEAPAKDMKPDASLSLNKNAQQTPKKPIVQLTDAPGSSKPLFLNLVSDESLKKEAQEKTHQADTSSIPGMV